MWIWQAFKQGFVESWTMFWAPVVWYTNLFKPKNWFGRVMVIILSLWLVASTCVMVGAVL